MKKIQKHIEIVRSTTEGLSSLNEKSAKEIHGVLTRHYSRVGVSIINSIDDLERLVLKRPDLVFMGMKYLPDRQTGRRIWISGYLEQNHIGHTGSGQAAIELEQSKPLAKDRVAAEGVKTSPYLVIKNSEHYDLADTGLIFPLFVKPSGLGAGKGVDEDSVVKNPAELRAKIWSLAENFSSDSLVEEFLPGREFSVGVLKDEFSECLTVMPLEMLPGINQRGDRLLSKTLKSAALETPVATVGDPKLRESLTDLATQAFIALGARDYGRIDIRLDKHGIPHFLEANLIPSLICNSGNFQKACVLNAGMDHENMILHIVRLGFAHEVTGAWREAEQEIAALFKPVVASIPA